MLCTGTHCPKKDQCGRYYANCKIVGLQVVESYYSYGSGCLSADGNEITHVCGEYGNWGMYKPIERNIETE